MIDSLSIAVHGFARHIDIISVAESPLSRYVNLSTNFNVHQYAADSQFSGFHYSQYIEDCYSHLCSYTYKVSAAEISSLFHVHFG